MAFIDRIARERARLKAWMWSRAQLIELGPGAMCFGKLPHVDARHGGRVQIGADLRLYGLEARAHLRTEADGQIRIGDRALINSGALVHAASDMQIGSDFRMASFAAIVDTDSHEVVPGQGVRVARIVIGDGVWIGRGAIILPGVHIGDGAVVGAGSIVTRSVDAYSVVAGNPARRLRSYAPTTQRRR
jgi:acetyltransferase-like isoleucine patch superfamily enzyme